MKYICFYILVISALFSYAQETKIKAPKYKTIKKNIAKEDSNFFYKNLLQRYKNSDTTMTLEEKRHLYYGYVYHEDYSPYGSSDYEDSLKACFEGAKS
jgi:dethiobiotin synthetase